MCVCLQHPGSLAAAAAWSCLCAQHPWCWAAERQGCQGGHRHVGSRMRLLWRSALQRGCEAERRGCWCVTVQHADRAVFLHRWCRHRAPTIQSYTINSESIPAMACPQQNINGQSVAAMHESICKTAIGMPRSSTQEMLHHHKV